MGLETPQNTLRLQGCDSESQRFFWPNAIFVIVTLRFYCDFCGKSLRLRSCDCQSLAICDCDCAKLVIRGSRFCAVKLRKTREGWNCRFQKNTPRGRWGPGPGSVDPRFPAGFAFPGARKPRICSICRFGKIFLDILSGTFPEFCSGNPRTDPGNSHSHSLRIYPHPMVWPLPRPWSQTMVSDPL